MKVINRVQNCLNSALPKVKELKKEKKQALCFCTWREGPYYTKCKGRALWAGETMGTKAFWQMIRVFERSLKEELEWREEGRVACDEAEDVGEGQIMHDLEGHCWVL